MDIGYRGKETTMKPGSTQQFLDIEEIKEGTVVLKDGTLRIILMTSAINFALKSSKEQEAIIYHYQSFLNSLDFPVQIVINSRRLNITSYLETLEEREKSQTNELLKIQTAEYREFIRGLVEMANIMKKTFYVVVPFAPIEAKRESLSEKLKVFLGSIKVAKLKKERFAKYKDQLLQRVEHVATNLEGVGVRMAPLNTQELIELFYTLYNPGLPHEKGVAEISQLEIEE